MHSPVLKYPFDPGLNTVDFKLKKNGSTTNNSKYVHELVRLNTATLLLLAFNWWEQSTMCDFHNFGLIFAGQCTVCLKG